MVKLGWIINKILYKIKHNDHEVMSKYYRRRGAAIGKRCVICSNLDLCDSFLLEIKDDVVISTEVKFVTHDWSASRVLSQKLSLWGKIIIGNNVFIGEGSIVMYGVELADNIVVAAGSVVTNSFFESNIIIGSKPARKIGT